MQISIQLSSVWAFTSSNLMDSSRRNCCASTVADSVGRSRISMAALRDRARESRWYEGVWGRR